MTEVDSKAVKIFWATRKALVFAVMLVLGGLVLVSAVVVPQFQQGMELYDDLQSEKPKLEKLEKKLAELESIEISPEFAQVETVEKALPSKKPLLELMVALSSVSQETGVEVTEFEISPGIVATDSTQVQTRQSGNYDELALTLSVSGTFNEIQNFLLKVEEVAPFTTIVSMEIGNQLNQNTDGEIGIQDTTFEAELITETYFFTQPISSRIDTPLPKIADREIDVLNFLASFTPAELQEQTEIRGGGLEDLFQITPGLAPTPVPVTTVPARTPAPTVAPEETTQEETVTE